MSVPSISARIRSVAWSAILAFLILGLGQGVWGALLVSNLRTSPAIPWAVAVMFLILWLMWQYLGGKGWPQSTSETRRRYLRANRVSGQEWAWGMLAGVLSIVALAGYWIVMFRLVKMPGNVLPDFSKYPMMTVVLVLVMASLVSPFTEESAFRGYCQVILEREFRGPVAVLISSVLFALAHVTQGFLWPKLLVYFLAGVVFGATAYFTASILPGMAVHIIADLTFFVLVWPYDAKRQLVWAGGADRWFWLHTVQAIIFTALAVIAFSRLARVSERVRAVADERVVPGLSPKPVA
jgi:membrane protease YdiL (CAAX protease family)